jgi:hypothetical protein
MSLGLHHLASASAKAMIATLSANATSPITCAVRA